MAHTHHSLPRTQTVLYATAESAAHDYLAEVTGCPVVGSARQLSAVEDDHLVVVPACTQRDLTAITHAAQALTWLKATNPQRTLVLAEPLGNATYAIARMRHHIRAHSGTCDALLFIAATIDPFADAELLRRVRLAQQFSESMPVEVAFDDAANAPCLAWPTPAEALERLGTLGHRRVIQVRADLYASPDCAHQPLYKPTSLREAVLASAQTARHHAAHGDDGIAAGLAADHGAGFAHSHGHDHDHHHHHH